MQQDRECPFCAATILRAAFLESDNFLAVYNIAPALPGHSLVVPRRHIVSFLDLTPAESQEIVCLSQDVATVLLRVFATRAFDWSIQEKESAGQTIEHLHLHVVPRVDGDLPRPGDWHTAVRASEAELVDSGSRRKLTVQQLTQSVEPLRRAGLQLVEQLRVGRVSSRCTAPSPDEE